MSEFDELDDILLFLKQRKETEENHIDDFDEKPIKSRSQRAKEEKERLEQERLEKERIERERLEQERLEQERIEKQNKQLEEQKTKDNIEIVEETKDELLPPIASVEQESEFEASVLQEKYVWITANGKINKEKKHKTSKKSLKSFVVSIPQKIKEFPENLKNGFKNRFIPGLKRQIKSDFTKQMALFLALIVAFSGLIVGGDRLYEYSKVAYLKPYQQKYPNVDFPQGILEEMCDTYAQNNACVGALKFDDIELETTVTYQCRNGCCYAPFGKDDNGDEQFVYIDINQCGDFEKIYSNSFGYVNAKQLITYTSLYGKCSYQVIATFYTNTNPQDDKDYVFPYGVYGTLTEKSFDGYTDRLLSRSLYDTVSELDYNSKYITVSMDSDFMPGFKFVIVGVSVDEEKFEKNTDVSENDNVHYPQCVYDLYGSENPFRFSSKWYPEIYTDSSLTDTLQLTSDDFELLK